MIENTEIEKGIMIKFKVHLKKEESYEESVTNYSELP